MAIPRQRGGGSGRGGSPSLGRGKSKGCMVALIATGGFLMLLAAGGTLAARVLL